MNGNARTIGGREARLIGLALTTALASATLSGCAASKAPAASVSASKAENAIASGKQESAVSHAEAAVLAEPRNAQYRAMLGSAYLEAGRYVSAAASFDDAIALGDSSGRTALSLALSLSAQGKYRDALQVLDKWQHAIAPGDLGLAYTLAGNPKRGVAILSDTLRNGENTPKIRQNLAYSYAMGGLWREARLMTAQDLPADKVSDRIAEWAVEASPDAFEFRVAKLLSIPFNVSDPGQPVHLALSNFPEATQLAGLIPVPSASAVPETPVASAAPATASHELPPIGDPVDSSVAVARYDTPQSTAAPAPATRPAANQQRTSATVQPLAPAAASAPRAQTTTDTASFAQQQVRQQPVRPAARSTAPAPQRTAAAPSVNAGGSHLVQLGSFASEASAKRAWNIYVKRYPELANHDMVISQAVVNGKNFWRVSAGGYSAGAARAMCGKVNGSSRDGCIAYAASNPLPGAVDNGRRLASR